MKYGIYYAYWEKEWGGNFVPYTEKCARLGFDILEVACGAFDREDDRFFRELAAAAKANGLRLTGGYGPRKGHDLAGTDPAQVEAAFRFYADMFRKMELAGIDRLGGALYSYWPAQCTPETDKAADTDRSVARMQRLADLAADHGITLCMEALNRFEGYMINTADECLAYVRAVNRPNVKVMLDTFHMNIEEDSLTDAIRKSGPLLGHFHVGEANRRCRARTAASTGPPSAGRCAASATRAVSSWNRSCAWAARSAGTFPSGGTSPAAQAMNNWIRTPRLLSPGCAASWRERTHHERNLFSGKRRI